MSDETSVTVRITDVDVGGVRLAVSSAGPVGGPAVVLLHGFPEIGYAWRHQIRALAAAGYRVLAPDQRGYGWSDRPEEVQDYAMDRLVGDVTGLLDAEGIERATIVGHDWGARVATSMALKHPARVRALGLLSAPYVPRGDHSLVEMVQRTDPDGPFDFVLAFQDPDAATALDADPYGTLRRIYWSGCAGAVPGATDPPAGLPPYLGPGEFENYFRAFAKSGFGPAINWFRNLEADFEAAAQFSGAVLEPPVLFLAGADDFAVVDTDGAPIAAVQDLTSTCRDLRGVHFVPDASHWVQQEAPQPVSDLLLAFLEDVS